MKDEWKIVNEFVSHGIHCFIAKLERGERPDKDWANITEAGFYQYNGYCVVPSGYSLRGIIEEPEYDFLKARLKNPSRIWN